MSEVLLAVVGHPVAHSRSPAIHAAFARALGHAVRYERLDAPPGQFDAVLAAFAARGARGCNVTVPYKFDAHAAAAHHSPRATLAGAANTLRFDAGGWLADNTDGAGLVHDLTVHAGWPLAGQRLLLLGAGGAAAGVLGALIAARPAAIQVVNRTADKAASLCRRHAGHAAAHGVALSAAPLAAPGRPFDGLINATASSLQGAELSLPDGLLADGGWAVDLMYGAAAAPFLAWARAQGGQARDGLGMLVAQAAESYALWLGQRPDAAPVLAALRAEVDAA